MVGAAEKALGLIAISCNISVLSNVEYHWFISVMYT